MSDAATDRTRRTKQLELIRRVADLRRIYPGVEGWLVGAFIQANPTATAKILETFEAWLAKRLADTDGNTARTPSEPPQRAPSARQSNETSRDA